MKRPHPAFRFYGRTRENVAHVRQLRDEDRAAARTQREIAMLEEVKHVHFSDSLSHMGEPAEIIGLVMDAPPPGGLGLCYRVRYEDGASAVWRVNDPRNHFVDRNGRVEPPPPAARPATIVDTCRAIENVIDAALRPLSKAAVVSRLREIYSLAEQDWRQVKLRALSMLGMLLADLDDESGSEATSPNGTGPVPATEFFPWLTPEVVESVSKSQAVAGSRSPDPTKSIPRRNGPDPTKSTSTRCGPDPTKSIPVQSSTDAIPRLRGLPDMAGELRRKVRRSVADSDLNPPTAHIEATFLMTVADYIESLESQAAVALAEARGQRGPVARVNGSFFRP